MAGSRVAWGKERNTILRDGNGGDTTMDRGRLSPDSCFGSKAFPLPFHHTFKCEPRVRKAFNQLTCAQRTQLVNAIKALKANGVYNDIVRVHWDNAGIAHGKARAERAKNGKIFSGKQVLFFFFFFLFFGRDVVVSSLASVVHLGVRDQAARSVWRVHRTWASF
jgi:hypothetical protein